MQTSVASKIQDTQPLSETASEKTSNMKFWEAEATRWGKRKQQCLKHYKKLNEVTKEKLQLELEHSGNLRFVEINIRDNEIKNPFKTKVDSFICPYLKGKVREVLLLNVWAVQGPYTTTVMQSQFKDSWDDVFILSPVQDLCEQLLQFVEDLLFRPYELGQMSVGNCFSSADSLVSDSHAVHRQLLFRSPTLLQTRLLLLCGVQQGTELLLSQQANCNSPHQLSSCCLLPLAESVEVVPLYLVHYQYVFQDYFKPVKDSSLAAASEATPWTLSDMSLLAAPPTDNIADLVLSNCNIHDIDIPVMGLVTVLNLSFNHLSDLSSIGKTFPKLTSLDLAFNKISSLDTLQEMKLLSKFVLKWNFLTNFQSSLKKLAELSSLKHLDLSWNPFCDDLSEEKEEYFVCHYLKSLLTFNGRRLSRSQVAGAVLPVGQDQLPSAPAPVWRSPSHQLTLRWRTETSAREHGNHLGVIADHIVSMTLQEAKLTQLSVSFPTKKLKWLDLSHNLIECASVLEGLPTLEEVNLSFNAIEDFSCPGGKLKRLTKLNLSHNYISSLANFNAQSLPNLQLLDLSNNYIRSLEGMGGAVSLMELYLSHNLVEDCETLVHCREWRRLSVLDLSGNPVAERQSFRHSCL